MNSYETYKNAVATCQVGSPSHDEKGIHDSLSRIRQAADSLLDEAMRIGFIDWDYSDVKNYNYKLLCEAIDNISNGTSLMNKEEVICLAAYEINFLAAARRPWRYSRDIAHKKLLKHFLTEHGVSITV